MLVEQIEDAQAGEFATSRSLGLGGCGFLSDEEFAQGSIVRVGITVGSKVISAKARVAYQIPAPDGKYETGLEFLDLGAADRAILEDLVDGGN